RPAPSPGSQSFTPDFFLEQMFGSSLGPAGAVVTGISAYLAALLLTPFSAALLANFFLLAQNPPAPLEVLNTRMVPLRLPEDEAPAPQAPAPGGPEAEPVPPPDPGPANEDEEQPPPGPPAHP
ncbi:MAG: hypothetical protein WD178_11370, partial [Actinomycetota bacterium]